MTFDSCLVTGASGFLGRALTAHLLKLGKRVVAAGRPGRSVLPPADRVLRVSFPDPATIKAELGAETIDVVFHCAAYGVAPDQRDPAEMFHANVAGVGAWTEAAAAIGARGVVYAGSCSEYGQVRNEVLIGEDTPLAAVDLYGASKAAGGQWGRAAAQRLGIGFQWLRLFGVFGPGEAPHRLVPYLAAKLSAGQRVDLTPGEQQRDFLYVEDAVRGMILAAEAAAEGSFGPFNICSGCPVSVRTFATAVAEIVDSSAVDLLDFGSRRYRPDEHMWMVGDPTKFSQATGFRPAFELHPGLVRTVDALECRR
jgi:UDP-glucose 4-epimerase